MDKQNSIDKVKNPLGLIVFGTLILETFLAVALTTEEENKLILIFIMVGFVFIMILTTLLISWFKPEVLRGERVVTDSGNDVEKLKKGISNLEKELAQEKFKVEKLESDLKKAYLATDSNHLERLKSQIVNHCSTSSTSTFERICKKMGIENCTSVEAQQISALLGEMKSDGILNDNYVLRN